MIESYNKNDVDKNGEPYDDESWWRKHRRPHNDINNKLTDTNYTQFVCVTLPEYLSVYEMERFIQKVLYYNIDCKTIIINKIIEEDNHDNCIYCSNQYINQEKYLDVIDDLYSEDFNIIYIPRLINVEIKNVDIFTSYLYNRVDYLD